VRSIKTRTPIRQLRKNAVFIRQILHPQQPGTPRRGQNLAREDINLFVDRVAGIELLVKSSKIIKSGRASSMRTPRRAASIPTASRVKPSAVRTHSVFQPAKSRSG
jgi:hypothetical protein